MRGSRAFLREPVMRLFQTALACLGALLLASVAMAADLAVGTETTIGYSGAYEEYTIPSGIATPAELRLYLKGGDGGKRVVPGLCKYKGGRGAKVFARFTVGTGAGELRPGGTIRFIVGNKGDKNRSNNIVGAGGGGGTAVLYANSASPGCSPTTSGTLSSSWALLAVAGGGGGSFLNPSALSGSTKDNGGQTSTPDPGYVTYTLGPPTSVVAICRDVTLDLGSGGTATLLATDVDGGSIFPVVTSYTPTHELRIKKGSIPQFFAAAASLDYDCSELGDGFVRLYALLEDGKVINDLDSCVAPITVRDSRDFTLTDLPDVVVIADGDGCSATVSGLPVPSPQGLCAQTGVTLTYWGQRFPAVGPSTIIGLTDGELHSLDVAVGSATIEYSGESDGGGTSPATSYDIVVKSGQAPVARCHDVSLQLDATGHASISASQIDGTGGTPSLASEDPCGTPVALSLDKSAFTCADAGANAVTLTVTQSAGLSSTCAATVTVGADSVDPSTPGCAAAVNDPPTITAPATIAVTEDVPKALTDLSFADVDAAPDAVSVTLTVGSGALAATTGGGVTVGGTATALTLDGTVAAIDSFLAGGGVTFTPAADSIANVTLGVLIDDQGHNGGGGAKSASQNVTLVLGPVNDPPTVTAPATIAVTEDVASSLVGLVFADPDAGTEGVRANLSVPRGSLAAAPAVGVTPGGSAGDLTLEGSLSAINGLIAGGGLTFTTAPDDTDPVALTIGLDDLGHTGSGGPLTATATVGLLVTAVNDPPTIDAPSALTFTVRSPFPLQGLSFDDAEAGGLDVQVTLDVDGGVLAFAGSASPITAPDLSQSADGSPATGTAGLTASGPPTALTLVGSLDELNAAFAAGEVIYTADQPGTFTLTVEIDDRGAGVGPPEQATATVPLDVVARPLATPVPALGFWAQLALFALLAGAALLRLR